MTEAKYTRYVALGDSQTEGLNDGDDLTGYRGWADRLAEHLAAVDPDVRYANLAVRGKLAAEIKDEQLAPALALRPDFATVVAGMNDMLRPSFDPDVVVADVEEMYRALTAAGAAVATVTYPDISKIVPIARPLLPRVIALNDRIKAAAARHGVLVFDSFPHEFTTHPEIWSADRLHASPLGHARIAAGMAHTIGLSGFESWADPLPSLPTASPLRMTATEVRWAGSFLGPWIMRRVRGKSSGDGRSAKRPTLSPVVPGMP